MQIIVYVLYGLAALFFLVVLCMFRNIKVSIAVLKTAATVITINTRMLLVPFFSAIFIFGYMFLWLWGSALLLSCGKIEIEAGS